MRALALLPVLIGSIYAVVTHAPVERLALLFVLDALFFGLLIIGAIALGKARLKGGASTAHRALAIQSAGVFLCVYALLSLYGVVLLAGGSGFGALPGLISASAGSILVVMGLRAVTFAIDVKRLLPATNLSQCILQLLAPLVAYLCVFILGELGASSPTISTALFGATLLVWAYAAADITAKWPWIGEYVRNERSETGEGFKQAL